MYCTLGMYLPVSFLILIVSRFKYKLKLKLYFTNCVPIFKRKWIIDVCLKNGLRNEERKTQFFTHLKTWEWSDMTWPAMTIQNQQANQSILYYSTFFFDSVNYFTPFHWKCLLGFILRLQFIICHPLFSRPCASQFSQNNNEERRKRVHKTSIILEMVEVKSLYNIQVWMNGGLGKTYCLSFWGLCDQRALPSWIDLLNNNTGKKKRFSLSTLCSPLTTCWCWLGVLPCPFSIQVSMIENWLSLSFLWSLFGGNNGHS